MTWLKKSDDFAVQCEELSDAAYRTHDEALLWVMGRERGPVMPKRDLRRFAATKTGDMEKAAAELVHAGFWRDLGNSYEVLHHMEWQVEPEVIARRREMDAARQRKARHKKAGLDVPEDTSRRDNTRDSDDDVTRDDKSDNTRDSGLGWTGRGGTGNYAPTDQVESADLTCPADGCIVPLRAKREREWGYCADHRPESDRPPLSAVR